MPRYKYRVADEGRNILEGAIDADNKEMATETLKDKGYSVMSLEEEKRGLGTMQLTFLERISPKDVVIFTRQFAVLIGAKVPVVQGLRTVGRQTKNPALRRIVLDISREVESGTALSSAMANYPKAFSQFFVNIIRSGETTGRLEEVMNYLADQMEKDYDLISRIKGAMTYPIFVVIGLVAVGFIMMTFVVPKLTQSLTESGTELPWTTKSLIFVSNFFQNHYIVLLVGAVVFVVLFRAWTSTPDGRRLWDGIKLRIPVFGPLIQHIAIVRFTRSLATLLIGGVDVPRSLEICADIVGNETYKRILQETKKEVSDGNSITKVFYREKTIPSMIPQMLTVGEETGRLSQVLEKLTDFYGRELDNSVSNLVSAIEPIIMLVMGGAVGVMVAAIMMPMYQMALNM